MKPVNPGALRSRHCSQLGASLYRHHPCATQVWPTRTTTHEQNISRAELEVIGALSGTVWDSRRFPGVCQLRIMNRVEFILSMAPLLRWFRYRHLGVYFQRE